MLYLSIISNFFNEDYHMKGSFHQRLPKSVHLLLNHLRSHVPCWCLRLSLDLGFQLRHGVEYLIEENHTRDLDIFCARTTQDHITFLYNKMVTLYMIDSIFGSIFFLRLQTKAILVLLAWKSINISSKLVSAYTVNRLELGFMISSALNSRLLSFKYRKANSFTFITPVTLLLFSL